VKSNRGHAFRTPAGESRGSGIVGLLALIVHIFRLIEGDG
jgi:hypothetical protein